MKITIQKAIELAAGDNAAGEIILAAARVIESRMSTPQESEKSIANNWGNPDASLSLHEAMAIQSELNEVSRRSQTPTDTEFLQSTTSAEITTPLSAQDAIDVWRRVVGATEFD